MGFLIADAVTGGSPDYAGMAREQESRRESRVNQGISKVNQAFNSFTPQFYQERAQAYDDYALPQLSEQYNQTRNQIGFNLANRGLNKSGAADNQWSALATQMTRAKQNIVDTGISQAQDLRKQVENARDAQYNLVYQSADPAAGGAGAIASAAGFATPSTFAPIANQFSNLIQQYYYNQLINSARPQQSAITMGGGAMPTSTGAPVPSPEVSVNP